MKQLWMLALVLGLSACSNGAEKELRSQVETLTRENVALKAERDALKAQLGVVAGGVAQANAAANRTALASYARRCSTALEIVRIDAPDGELPQALDGASCDGAALGENAVQKPDQVSASRVTLDPGATYGYRIEVTGAGGEQLRYPE